MFEATALNRRNRQVEWLVRALFLLMTVVLIIPVIIILTVLTVKGHGAISWAFLTTAPTNGMTEGGILPALVGTIWLVAVALIASVPLGVAAAIYLSEYAPDNWLTRVINLAIINLAGVPSIVHALFGLGAFVLFFRFGTSILAASLTLAIMTLPVVIVSTREALQSVPRAFREACWNMGATRWQTIWRVVLPNAISGILTGIILEVSRTAGETAPIMFTGAALYLPFLPQSVMDQTMAMSLHLYVISLHWLPDVSQGEEEMVGHGESAGSGLRREFGLDDEAVAKDAPVKLEVQKLTLSYGTKAILRDVSFQVREHEIFGIIGPANSGKTSFLRALNRMNEMVPGMQVEGTVLFNGEDVNSFANVYALRRRIGVVFPLPVGLPLSIYDNVALSPRLAGVRKKAELDVIVERCLTRAALWDEVKDRLHALGSLLSGGQQQRLTIARALSQEPELLLLDEFSIAVDPVTTMRIEDVLKELRKEMTIVLVTNLVQQARRLAQRTAFFLNGELVEVGDTEEFFTGEVRDVRTREYVEGKFG